MVKLNKGRSYCNVKAYSWFAVKPKFSAFQSWSITISHFPSKFDIYPMLCCYGSCLKEPQHNSIQFFLSEKRKIILWLFPATLVFDTKKYIHFLPAKFYLKNRAFLFPLLNLNCQCDDWEGFHDHHMDKSSRAPLALGTGRKHCFDAPRLARKNGQWWQHLLFIFVTIAGYYCKHYSNVLQDDRLILPHHCPFSIAAHSDYSTILTSDSNILYLHKQFKTVAVSNKS